MGKGANVVLGVLLAAGVIGMKFYNKSSSHDEAKTRLVELCEQDNACVQVVEQHYDGCFDDAYTMGGRRRSSSFDVDELVSCINTKSGTEYFGTDTD